MCRTTQAIVIIAVTSGLVGCRPVFQQAARSQTPTAVRSTDVVPSPTANLVPVTQVLPTADPMLPVWWLVTPPTPRATYEVTKTVDIPYTSTELLDVYAPTSGPNWPVAVVLHGKGDYKGMMSELASAIASQGAVVFVPTYRAGAPKSPDEITVGVEDAACAVRFGRAHASQYGGRSNRLVVVGYSAGGLMGAVLMLAGDDFHGDCLTRNGSAVPDAFVGLDGSYDPIPFISDAVLQQAQSDVLKLDPFNYIGQRPKRPGATFLLFVGSYETAQRHAQAFRDALEAAQYSVDLLQVRGMDHREMARPQPATLDAIWNLLLP